MAVNGVTATGDDQQWKLEVERKLQELERQLKTALSQISNLNRGQ